MTNTEMKHYGIDTNIILDDYKNIYLLSDDKKNMLYITETVLNEIDKYKNGNETINFNAREFIRILNDSKAEYNKEYEFLYIENHKFKLKILKDIENKHDFDNNDDIIIETLTRKIPGIIFISNDLIFRTKCFLKGKKAYPLKNYYFSPDIQFEINIETEELIPNKEYFTVSELKKLGIKNIEEHISFINITDGTGKLFVFIRDKKNTFKQINLKENINILGIKPKNLEQRKTVELLLSDNDIIIIEARAGTGKTLLSLITACKLIDNGKFNKITYIRKTLISGEKLDELGFLPGSIQEKMKGYLFPLKDNIETIILNKNKRRKKKLTQNELLDEIQNFEDKYNINYEYQGHLRGRTIDGIVILDEASNFSIKDIQLILSRIKEGSKVFIIGSINQIDNPYLNKYNNSLTFLMNHTGSYKNLNIRGIRLNKVERGPIVDWIETLVTKTK